MGVLGLVLAVYTYGLAWSDIIHGNVSIPALFAVGLLGNLTFTLLWFLNVLFRQKTWVRTDRLSFLIFIFVSIPTETLMFQGFVFQVSLLLTKAWSAILLAALIVGAFHFFLAEKDEANGTWQGFITCFLHHGFLNLVYLGSGVAGCLAARFVFALTPRLLNVVRKQVLAKSD